MNRDIAKKWIVALESGAYPQARGELLNRNGLCCLGVLMYAVPESLPGRYQFKVGNARRYDREDSYGYVMDENGSCVSTTMIPSVVVDHVGMAFDLGDIFANLNDVYKLDFIQIAQVIRNLFDIPLSEVE